jgi:hypothetical protein
MASVSEPENFWGVIDACRCVLANFEGKLYTVLTVCVTVLFLNMPVATAMHRLSYVIRLKTSKLFFAWWVGPLIGGGSWGCAHVAHA